MVSFLTEKEICYSPHSAFYTSTRSLFQVVKQPTREADHSSISCSQFMKECSKTPSATSFLACTVVKLPLLSVSKNFQWYPVLFNGIHGIDVLPKQFPKIVWITEMKMKSITLKFKTITHLVYMCVLFFFRWHYSPLWALACRAMSFHVFLSATNSLHLLTPSTWRTLSTSSFHLVARVISVYLVFFRRHHLIYSAFSFAWLS